MPPKPKPPKPKNRQQRSRRRRAKPLRPAPAADASKSATTVPPAAAGICISRSPTKKEFILHVEAASACPLKKDAKKVQAEGQSATGSSPPYVNSAIAFILGGNEDLSDTDSDWDDDSDCGGTPDFPLDVLVMPLLNSFLSVSALADSRPIAQRRNGDQVDGRLPVSPLVQDANEKWNQMYHEDVGKTPRAAKVNFPLGDMLVQVHTADDFERKGPWEQIAVDRRRFQSRIASMECVLAPVLCAEHRQNVYRKIYASAATE
ncbi:hypothetical protein V5799_017201 [Amblyomma americanum]|uniref:Protein DP71L n=1 Tax=Amblyomma americanum TaxID=6943 RepID=A0AAQ4F336_AMBAM